MTRRAGRAALFLLLLLFFAEAATAGGGPQNVLVVANGRDAEATWIAEHYISTRGIPRINLVILDLPTDLETDLTTYQSAIEEPVKDHLARNGLSLHIDYLALVKGLPIRVALPSGRVSTSAALAVMDTPISGRNQVGIPAPQRDNPLLNPYRELRGFRHSSSFGGKHLYLVTWLTGYTAEDARALVDRAVAAEERPPEKPLFIFQDARGNAAGRNPQYPVGIRGLESIRREAIHEPAGADRVVDRKGIMGYMSGGSYSGLTEAGIGTNDYLPGAIADMLESFGAVPANFHPAGRSQVPVTWFVKHGITGVHGAVSEPYAHTFPDVRLFERYARGMNLAEAFHSSLPFLYWMNMVIGEPLCAPFVARPKVRFKVVPRPASGNAVIEVEADAGEEVAEIRFFLDGRPVGTTTGRTGKQKLDTRRIADGVHVLLAAAILAGPLETQGWATTTLTVENEGATAIGATVDEGGVRVQLSRPAAEAVTVRLAGVPAKDASAVTGKAELLVTPATPLPVGHEVEVALSGGATGVVSLVVPPAKFVIDAPKELRAGETVTLRIRATDAEGTTVPAFSGHLSVRLSDPPITGGEVALDRPEYESPFELEKAGEVTVTVRDRISGRTGRATINVLPGAVAACRVSPANLPQGQPTRVTATLLDRHGNRVTNAAGTLALDLPTDDRAEVPEAQALSGGQAVFAGVVAWRRGGSVPVRVRDGDGNVIPTNPVTVKPEGYADWLVLGPLPGKLEERGGIGPDPKPSAGHPGGGRIWREHRSRRDHVDLERALDSKKGVALAHLFIHVEEDLHASLRLGFGPKLTLYVDGKEIFTSPKAEQRTEDDREVIPKFPLKAGWRRILIAAELTGPGSAFSFRISDGAGNALPGVRTSLADPEKPRRISGRVLSGGRGMAGTEVRIDGPVDLSTRTGSDGSFTVAGLPPGRYRVSASAEGLTVKPSRHDADLTEKDASRLDFAVQDDEPPTVEITAPESGDRVGSKVVVTVVATDNAGLASIQIHAEGQPVGSPLAAAPFRFTIETKDLGSSVRLTAVATDTSGNRAESRTVRIRVVKDDRGPAIRILSPRDGKIFSGKGKLAAKVEDELAVASVTFEINGQIVGSPLTAEPFEIDYDPAGLPKGNHTLTVRAVDTEGNASAGTIRFRTR